MHSCNQQVIRKIAILLLCLHPEHERTAAVARRIFSTAREAVEKETGTQQSDEDHEKMFRRFIMPK